MSILVSVGLVCVAVMCVYGWLWLRGRRARSFLAGLPTYPEIPFIGNLYKFYGGGEVIMDQLMNIGEVCEEKNLPFVMWLGPLAVILLIDPDEIKMVTNAFLEKPYYYSFGRIWLGDGLVTAPGPVWKRNIKKLSGAFISQTVDGYQAVFNAQAQKLVEVLRGKADGQPLNVIHHLAYITMEAVCQTALGVPQISESIVTQEYYEAFNRAIELLIDRGLNLIMHCDAVYKMSPSYKEMVKCVEILHNVSDTVINKRTKEWKQNGGPEGEESNSGPKSRFKSFLDILLELSEHDPSLSAHQIKSEVATIIVGGQETVATTMLYALLMLGCHQQVQDCLYAEIKETFGDSKRPVEKNDLSRMSYCEAVILETLRMYPPIPGLMRYADKDLKIRSCTVPKGSAVVVNVWAAMRSRRTWGEDACEFKPERWLRPGYARAHGPAFLAFSTGRRSCIGRKYALALTKTLLVYCLREFQFCSEADKMRLKFHLALRPVSHHLLRVNLRSHDIGQES